MTNSLTLPTYYDCATQSELFDRLDDLTQVIDMAERINQLDVEVVMRLLDIARTASRKVRRGRRTGVLSSRILRTDMDGYYHACQVALDYGRKANTYLTMMVRMTGSLMRRVRTAARPLHVSHSPQPLSYKEDTMTTMPTRTMILCAFNSAPVRAAKLCLSNAEQSDSHAAQVYAEMAVEHANKARTARRARARYYKNNGFTASDPAIEAVLDRAWHSAKHCIERSLDLMQ